ncbi:hypothetical protein [Nannocystis pusilla]|uniref:Uncharacterized protein n=1 Tax=Nannocystis pusilla TaxID=889268 RepID=A0ABS7U689_9BACT|nr:hypothetical protein [Nannocystis pusilla]MBZ5716000.1 hypothetical protein [Nannocystis pusilla]
MLYLLPAVLSLALQPAAPVPAPPAAAQPAPAVSEQPGAQPTPPTLPAQPEAPAQPAVPAQPDAPPAAPTQPTAQPHPPAQPPYADQPYPPNYPNTPLPNNNVAEGPGALPEAVSHRKLVFANFYTLNFNILTPIPSGDFTFFLGTNLRPRKNRARTFDWNTALGYQLTLSIGFADVPTFDLSPIDYFAFFVHRHHLTAMGYGGHKQRLFYSMGAGAMFALSQIGGVEGEGRLGYVFTNPEKRVKGIVGGQARLTAAFGGIPLLQLGPFIGFMAF